MKSNVKILKFKATAEGFDQLLKDIKTLTTLTDGIKMPADFITKIQTIENLLKTVTSSLQQASKIDFMGQRQTQGVVDNLTTIEKELGSVLSLFGKFGLPASASAEMKTYLSNLEEATRRLEQIKNARPRLKVDENTGTLTRSGKVSAFRQTSFSGIEGSDKGGKGWITVGGKKYDTYNKLAEAARASAQNSDLRAVLEQVDQVMNANSELLERYATEMQKYYERVEEAERTVEKISSSKPQISSSPIESQYDKALGAYKTELNKFNAVLKESNDEEDKGINLEEQHTQLLEKKHKTLGEAVISTYAYKAALDFLKNTIRTSIEVVQKMDNALTGMSVVTTMSREETWQLVKEFQNLSKVTGKTTTEIAQMATKFYQQGKNTAEVLKLTEAAAKAATIAGISGAESIDLLTNAINGFQMQATQAMEVSDKFAALAASSATDYEELATALSKVAAQANLAGMSMDFTLGLLSKGIEVTREAPETIGTALKTVISRMRELTDYGKTLEDGMDVNRVASALNNVNIQMTDANGQFRAMEDVLTEVGQKWDTLNTNQQANIAVAMAGTRQQSRFIAMMQDFDRTLELVNISSNSYGATLAQQAKYMEGLEAKTTLLTNAWEAFILTFANSDIVISGIESLTGLIEFATKNTWAIITPLGIWLAYMTAMSLKQAHYNHLAREQQTLEKKHAIEMTEMKMRNAQSDFISAQEELKMARDKAILEAQAHVAELENRRDELQILKDKAKALRNEERARAKAIRDDKILLAVSKEQTAEVYIRSRNSAAAAQTQAEAVQLRTEAEQEYQKVVRTTREDYNKNMHDIQQQEAEITEQIVLANRKVTTVTQEANRVYQEKTRVLQENHQAEMRSLSLSKQSQQLQLQEHLGMGRNILDFIIYTAQIIANTIALKGKKKTQQDLSKVVDQSSKLSTAATVSENAHTAAIIAGTEATRQQTNAIKENNAAQMADMGTDALNTMQDVTDAGVKSAGTLGDVFTSIGKFFTGKGGWITLAIVGVVVGLATLAQAIYGVQKAWSLYTDNVEHTASKLEDLQVSIYNLQQEQQQVSKLGDEFEELSSKISRTAEETERLVAIGKEINDMEGRQVIDLSASHEEQLKQIRAYETEQQLKIDAKTNEMSDVFAEGYKTAKVGDDRAAWATGMATTLGIGAGVGGGFAGAAIGAKIAGTVGSAAGPVGTIVGVILGLGIGAIAGAALGSAIGDAAGNFEADAQKQAYIDGIMNTESGRTAVKQYAQANIKGLDSLSTEMQRVVLDMTVDAANELDSGIIGENGLSVEKFQEDIANDALFAALATVEGTEKITDTWEQIKNLSKEQKRLLGAAKSDLGALFALENSGVNMTQLLNNLESKNISAEQLTQISNQTSQLLKSFGYDSEVINSKLAQIFADVANGVSIYDAVQAALSDINITESQRDTAQQTISDLKQKDYGNGRTLSEEITELEKMKEEGKEDTDDYKKRRRIVDDALADIAEAESLIENYDNQDFLKWQTIQEALNIEYPVEDANNFADAITNIDSKFERLNKAIAEFDTMGLAEKLQLIEDYPMLADAIMSGNLNADIIRTALQEDYETKAQEFITSRDNLRSQIISQYGQQGYDFITSNASGIHLGQISDADLIQSFGLEQYDATTREAILNNIKGMAYDFIKLETVASSMPEDFAEAITIQYQTQIQQMKELESLLNTQVSLLEKKLELEKASGSELATETSQNLRLLRSMQAASALKDIDPKKMEEEVRALMGTTYKSDLFTYSAGAGIQINANAWSQLTEEERANIAPIFDQLTTLIADTEKEIIEAYDAFSNLETVYIDGLKEQVEQEKELLEERKQNYEDYFEAVDQLQDSQDRSKTREDIIKQLGALSTGIGGATQNKIKELQSQLRDIEQDESEARREHIRNSLLEGIDQQIKNNDEALKSNTEAIKALTMSILYASNPSDFQTDGKWDPDKIRRAYEEMGGIKNKHGGLVDYTGFTWVDGSRSKPEAFLDAEDTLNIRALLDTFNAIVASPSDDFNVHSEDIDNSSAITIENISIHTDQLNNSQDFSAAGNALAREFAKVIQERGLNVNVKK